MKIYLAGGMTVMNVKGRERELAHQMPVWRRLFSFYFLELIEKSDILSIVRENENLSRLCRARRPKDSK